MLYKHLNITLYFEITKLINFALWQSNLDVDDSYDYLCLLIKPH